VETEQEIPEINVEDDVPEIDLSDLSVKEPEDKVIVILLFFCFSRLVFRFLSLHSSHFFRSL
jgi:hypothetical protein